MKTTKIFAATALLFTVIVETVAAAGCDDTFSFSATYGSGSKVTVDGVDYICVNNAYSIYCSGNKPPGKPGTFATVAWVRSGACSETIVGVVSGTGCESSWVSGNSYKSGDRVAVDGTNYQCVSNAYSLYCPGYKPGSGSLATLAWQSVGSCTGTLSPTPLPTPYPTNNPTTSKPTTNPTAKPTNLPTVGPTAKPTSNPTVKPTSKPTVGPTAVPTTNPTVKPTVKPTAGPTAIPTSKPTVKPTVKPTAGPTVQPTSKPTVKPTVKPTASPTLKPTHALANPSNPGCPGPWLSGTTYEPNDQVAVGNIIYQCDSVFFGHCPYREPGKVINDESWELIGSCIGTFKPTNSPTVNPNAPLCPTKYISGTIYSSGDRVSVGNIYYQCKEWPYSPYCGLSSFAPGSDNSDFGWIRMGSCK
ncbi:hypothetical protein ACHAXS_002206 [Conticribra weissflogii]